MSLWWIDHVTCHMSIQNWLKWVTDATQELIGSRPRRGDPVVVVALALNVPTSSTRRSVLPVGSPEGRKGWPRKGSFGFDEVLRIPIRERGQLGICSLSHFHPLSLNHDMDPARHALPRDMGYEAPTRQ